MEIRKILILLFCSVSFYCYSQQIENVDFSVKDNFVNVTYDLVNCPSKELYDIKLKVINDNTTIEPNSVTGDLKKVSDGRNKKIEWNVLNDKSELKGNIQVIVEIAHTYSTKIIGGPSNAFLSMLLPGLGDAFVGDKTDKAKWYYISGLYIGGAYGTYYYYKSYEKSYDLYINFKPDLKFYNPTTGAWIATGTSGNGGPYDSNGKNRNDYQNEYKRYKSTYVILGGITASIWLYDVIYVTVKGAKNRKEQLGYANNNSKVKFYFAVAPNNYRIGLIKNF